MLQNITTTAVAGSLHTGGARPVPGTLALMAACLVAWAAASSAFAGSVLVDGKVGGFAEGYTQGYDVTFDIESGPTGVTGGRLYIHETTTSLLVGMVTPLTTNDNTYAKDLGNDATTDTRADDWGTIQHALEKLEGSDKWEIVIDNFNGSGKKLEMKLDYIVGEKDHSPFWQAAVEKFKLKDYFDDPSKIDVHSSLDYNYNVLGMTSFFASKKDSSSPTASDGFYDFDNPNEDWLPEIAYEFEIQKSAFDGTGFALTSASFLNDIYGASIFHMSPNKLGGNKVYVSTVTPVTPNIVPLPAAAWMGMSLLSGIGLLGALRRRRRS